MSGSSGTHVAAACSAGAKSLTSAVLNGHKSLGSTFQSDLFPLPSIFTKEEACRQHARGWSAQHCIDSLKLMRLLLVLMLWPMLVQGAHLLWLIVVVALRLPAVSRRSMRGPGRDGLTISKHWESLPLSLSAGGLHRVSLRAQILMTSHLNLLDVPMIPT